MVIGTIEVSRRIGSLLASLGTGALDRIGVEAALRKDGVDAAVVDTLIATPTLRAIAVIAPLSGVIATSPVKAKVKTGQQVARLNVGAHTIAYGTVPASMPIPRQIDATIHLGTTSEVSMTAVPLLEIAPNRGRFGLPLPFATAVPSPQYASARLAATQPLGSFVAVPKDCVMNIHRSTEVLAHTGPHSLTRHPVVVQHRDSEYAYVTKLPERVDLVRDLDVVSKLFPAIASLMLGLANF